MRASFKNQKLTLNYDRTKEIKNILPRKYSRFEYLKIFPKRKLQKMYIIFKLTDGNKLVLVVDLFKRQG